MVKPINTLILTRGRTFCLNDRVGSLSPYRAFLRIGGVTIDGGVSTSGTTDAMITKLPCEQHF